jgi:hypothetical protein
MFKEKRSTRATEATASLKQALKKKQENNRSERNAFIMVTLDRTGPLVNAMLANLRYKAVLCIYV